jgi:A/G-specific adenine glycosylase
MLGGMWEFPGGKVEEGETSAGAVRRELREEMSIRVRVGPCFQQVDHAYSHLRVTLHAHHARVEDGRPSPSEDAATAWRWSTVGELDELPFPVANQKILAHLQELESAPEV